MRHSTNCTKTSSVHTPWRQQVLLLVLPMQLGRLGQQVLERGVEQVQQRLQHRQGEEQRQPWQHSAAIAGAPTPVYNASGATPKAKQGSIWGSE
jgi:hypothetical protein